jgi:hypothetical protein
MYLQYGVLYLILTRPKFAVWYCCPLLFLDHGCQIAGVLGHFKGTWFFKLQKKVSVFRVKKRGHLFLGGACY